MPIKTSQTKYPQSIAQPSTGSTITTWKNTNNLKSASSDVKNNYAQTNKINASGGTHPKIGTLHLQTMGFNIPEYAIITSIVVGYSYRLEAQVATKYPTIAAPTLALKSVYDTTQRKGATPTKDWKTKTLTYSSGTYALPSAKTINGDYFGVSIAFPKNTHKSNEGYVYLNNVYVTVHYTIPEFPVDLVMVGDENGEFIKDKSFKLQASINNPDLADTPPTIEITVPTGTVLDFAPNTITSNTLTKLSDTKYQLTLARWGDSYETYNAIDVKGNNISNFAQTTVRINTQKGAVTVDLVATVPNTGDKIFTITETRGSLSKSRTVTIAAQPTPTFDVIEVPMEQAIYAVQNTAFTVPLKIPVDMIGSTVYLYTDTPISILQNGTYYAVSNWYSIPSSVFDEEGIGELTVRTSNTGLIYISITNSNEEIPESSTFIVRVAPAGYDVPRFTVLKLSTEEANRLGNGFNYTVSADMRITCQVSAFHYFVDYYRNFRIGVVNSIPQTLNVETIFNSCRNWSDLVSVFNEFEEKTVDFTYDENYPVYIIISGNYLEGVCNYFECEFANLQIIENTREDGNFVFFPAPIKDILSDEEETSASLVLPENSNTNNLIFYDLGLDDSFSRETDIAIRGIVVKVTANSDDASVIYAQLKSPSGNIGERSVLLSDDTVHILGGRTDRWGFLLSELEDFSSFELELNISNIAGNNNQVTIEKVELSVYFTYYESHVVDWFIDGENMAGFNVFLEDVTIPEGLETSTKYLDVDGTDTNVAFRQNIKEKEITVEFDITECNIDEATATLQDITQILQTERDELYRPIPKKVEFSHYPGIYWNYILEEPIDAKATVSTYECKVKLTVPAGTAFTNDDIVAGKSGRVNGLAKVNPVIVIIPTASNIEISESFTDQTFTMTYSNMQTTDTIEIDCENRKIYLRNNDDEVSDITADAADWDTDWFLLYDQFLFEESGCVIQSVTWNERK